jgi:hypothetical protein
MEVGHRNHAVRRSPSPQGEMPDKSAGWKADLKAP